MCDASTSSGKLISYTSRDDWPSEADQDIDTGEVKFPWLVEHVQFTGVPAKQLGQEVLMPLQEASPDIIKQVAFWEAKVFGVRTADQRVQQYRKAFQALAAGHADPSPWGSLATLVIIDTTHREPLGAASLVKNDLVWSRRDHDLRPWISCLFVKAKMRGRGLGAWLAESVACAAQQHGFGELFVSVCPDRAELNLWYERQGFESWGDKLQGGFRIMRKDLPGGLEQSDAV